MATVNFSPIFNGWQGFTPDGIPLGGGLVTTYLAGTSTPAPTYTTSAGTVTNSNPIQLDAGGRPPSEIWLVAGQGYKFVLTDSLSNQLATYDNIVGIPYASSSIWSPTGLAPTYLNASQFSVVGDQTAVFPAGIRIRYTITATQYYGTVTASSFSAGVTTVTVETDSVPFTSGLNSIDVSQLSPTNSAVPVVSPLMKAKPATTSRASTTSLADDPDLKISLSQGAWIFRLWAPIWATTSGIPGFKHAMAFSGVLTSSSFSENGSINLSAAPGSRTYSVGDTLPNGNNFAVGTGVDDVDFLSITGTVTVGSAGVLSFQWAQMFSSSFAMNVGVGAWLECVKQT